jgi:hypothetical protein
LGNVIAGEAKQSGSAGASLIGIAAFGSSQ